MKKKPWIAALTAASLLVMPFKPAAASVPQPALAAGQAAQYEGTTGFQSELDGSINGKAELAGAYADAAQQEIPFGYRSFFLAPWRSYMDTWDGTRLLDALGVAFNVNGDEAEASATLLEEAGIRAARVEIGWTNVDYNDESKLRSHSRESFSSILGALKRHHVRPIILLNMNSGMPAPNTEVKVKLARKAEAGAREVYLENTAGIVPKYTGFKDMGPAMFPVITEVDSASGKAVLSAPLPKALPQGAASLVKLKYQPFSGPVFADGTPNPASQETLDGWMRYVNTVAGIVRDELGTVGQADAGFDIEVYNEYTFGHHFMYMNNYYSPKLEFAREMTYSDNGKSVSGIEVLLPMTTNFFRDPAQGYPGVRVISGFSNQRPWDSGTSIWPGQAGYSRHYYTGYDPKQSLIAPGSSSSYSQPNKHFYDALGQLDSARRQDNYDQAVPGSYYVPEHVAAFPELWAYAYQTETLIRDLQPFPGPWDGHFRYASPGGGQTAELWMTETNFWRGPWSRSLMAETGVDAKNPQLSQLLHATGAKALSRLFTFYAHKGVETMTAHALKGPDTEFSILPTAFFEELKKSGYQLTDEVRSKAGPQLDVLKNISAIMKKGQTLPSTRPLYVTGLAEYNPRLVFSGDGTMEHPARYNRDDFAVLPYQLNDHSFAVAYYVVTRDLTHAYRTDKPILDPERYAMPEQTFELTLSNVIGAGASVSAYDPFTGAVEPVEIISANSSSLTIRVPAMDYPRFLLIDEASPGPVIAGASMQGTAEGAHLTFIPSVSGVVEVTYGEYPVRSGGFFKEQHYADRNFKNLVSERNVQSLSPNLGLSSGSWRWTGTIMPQYTEMYTFTAYTDNMNGTTLRMNGQPVPLMGTAAERSVKLEAGVPVELEWSYFNTNMGRHKPVLFWSSASQERTLVPASLPGLGALRLAVKAGEPVTLMLPGLKQGDGARIRLVSDQGISTRYPFWDYDTKLVLYEHAVQDAAVLQQSQQPGASGEVDPSVVGPQPSDELASGKSQEGAPKSGG